MLRKTCFRLQILFTQDLQSQIAVAKDWTLINFAISPTMVEKVAIDLQLELQLQNCISIAKFAITLQFRLNSLHNLHNGWRSPWSAAASVCWSAQWRESGKGTWVQQRLGQSWSRRQCEAGGRMWRMGVGCGFEEALQRFFFFFSKL